MRDFFVRYRDPVGLVLALVLMAGLFAYTHIHSSLFPEVTFPKVKIIADNGLQPVDKMMVTVTRPLEAAIERTPMLQDIRSAVSRITSFPDDAEPPRVERRQHGFYVISIAVASSLPADDLLALSECIRRQ